MACVAMASGAHAKLRQSLALRLGSIAMGRVIDHCSALASAPRYARHARHWPAGASLASPLGVAILASRFQAGKASFATHGREAGRNRSATGLRPRAEMCLKISSFCHNENSGFEKSDAQETCQKNEHALSII